MGRPQAPVGLRPGGTLGGRRLAPPAVQGKAAGAVKITAEFPLPVLAGTAALGDVGASGGLAVPMDLTGTAALGDVGASGGLAVPMDLTGTAALGDVGASGGLAVPMDLTGTAALGDVGASGGLAVQTSGSCLSDSSPLIAGAALSSAYDGHGARFSDLPTTGEHGPSLQANDTGVGASQEVRLLLKSVPPLLTSFQLDELGRVIATGPDGVHVGTADHYADGVPYGLDTPYYIVIGSTLSGSATLDGVGAGGSLGIDPGVPRPFGRTLYVGAEQRRLGIVAQARRMLVQ